MRSAREALFEQIKFLMNECRKDVIPLSDLLKLIEMAYKDFLDFHPEEHPANDEFISQYFNNDAAKPKDS